MEYTWRLKFVILRAYIQSKLTYNCQSWILTTEQSKLIPLDYVLANLEAWITKSYFSLTLHIFLHIYLGILTK